jgi:MYXO-CTERM domain-containing protein
MTITGAGGADNAGSGGAATGGTAGTGRGGATGTGGMAGGDAGATGGLSSAGGRAGSGQQLDGGCSCEIPSAGDSSGAASLALLAFVIRRRSKRPQRDETLRRPPA